MKTEVGFLGPKGSFSEEAAHKILAAKYLPFPSISELLQAFWNKEIDEAVLPLDNSIGGIVSHTADGLIAENGNNFFIKGEIILPVEQHFIGKKGAISGKIEKVISHPQALAQCAKFIEELGVETENFSSTSGSVEAVAESDNSRIAAIGTRRAAEIYGLEILAENIQGSKSNVTRFIVLGRHNDMESTGNDKTSLIFEVENVSGALVEVLLIFAKADISMTKIISIPLKTKLDEYIFWVDVEGHQNDEKIEKALGEVEGGTFFMKVLGSYPKSNLEV